MLKSLKCFFALISLMTGSKILLPKGNSLLFNKITALVVHCMFKFPGLFIRYDTRAKTLCKFLLFLLFCLVYDFLLKQ